MKKCKLVQNIMNFKFCYIIFCTIICFIVLSVPTFAKENSDNVIRVGSFEETYNTVNEKGERSGYGYEYLQDIAGYAGWTYKYITSDWKNCFTQLENGEIDILGGISYTDERAENMLFSDMPMGEEKYYIYTDASNKDLTAGNLDSFEGKNIGVFKDNITEDVLNEWELKYQRHLGHRVHHLPEVRLSQLDPPGQRLRLRHLWQRDDHRRRPQGCEGLCRQRCDRRCCAQGFRPRDPLRHRRRGTGRR